jgi:hypothetical protein
MLILIGIQLIVIVLFSLLGWAIREKNYRLISNLATSPPTSKFIDNAPPIDYDSLII